MVLCRQVALALRKELPSNFILTLFLVKPQAFKLR